MNIAWLYILLVVIGCALGLLLMWFIVELIFTTREARRRMANLITKYSRMVEKDKIPFTYIKGDYVERQQTNKTWARRN